VEKIGGDRVRILKIDTVGFTNQANGKELLTPMTNRGESPGKPASTSRCKPQHGAAFQALANRVQSELGTDWTTAWNLSREIFPHVYNTAFDIDDPVLPRTSRQTREADERQGFAIARASIIANRGSFAVLHGEANRSTPMLMNRAACPEGTPPAQWNEALRRAPDVIAAIEESCNCTPDRGRSMLFRGPWHSNIVSVFAASIKGLMQANGWTAREASEFLKSTEPVLWGAGVMNYK